MSYIVFARKYRPQTFDDIIGQSHITTTLKNAISQDRVAHAYLFAGPRGVGKTTTARIFAKALNCEKGPTPKPCNTCQSCQEITKSTNLDILEIDGASNRGIDEIRNLRENVKFSPSKGRFKIYIIDEVHMLTPEAFNALLKTLEEPPGHVKFIFATTQAYKVPSTILSRCQRFDFRRIGMKDILDNLKAIAKQEGLHINDEALSMISKYADGSIRDAQVVLDQISSFTQGDVDVQDVVNVLGIVDDEILFGLSGSIRKKDTVSGLKIIDRFVNEGKDVVQVVLSLVEHFRNISMAKISADLGSLIDTNPDKIKRYEAEAKEFTIEEILYIIYTLAGTIDFIRKSNLPRIPFETAVVKLTQSGSLVSLDEVMKKLDGMQRKIASPAPVAPARNDKMGERTQGQPVPAELNELLSAWESIINFIKTKKISIASYLQEGYPVSLESNTLTIGFAKELQFHKEVLESPDNRKLIEDAIRITMNLDLKVALTLVEPVARKDRPLETDALVNSPDAEKDNNMEEKEIDPIVKSAMDIFNGQIANQKGRA